MSGPFELNEHGLWCPCCGNLIASPATANADDYQAPAECGQCGFPEDADKVAAYHGFDGDDDDDEPDDDTDAFECPRYWIAGKGGGWACPLIGTEDCDWECPN